MPDPWGGFNQGFNQLINVLQFKRQEERDKTKNLLAIEKQKMEMAKMKREEETAKMQDAVTYSRDMTGDGSPEDIAKFNARRSMWVQKWGEDPKLPKEYDPKYIAALKGLETQKFEQIGAGGLYDITSKKTIPPVEKPGTPIVNWKTPEGKIKNLPQGVMPPEGSVQIDKEKPEKELKGKDKIINDLLESGRLTDQEKKMIAGAIKTDPAIINIRQSSTSHRQYLEYADARERQGLEVLPEDQWYQQYYKPPTNIPMGATTGGDIVTIPSKGEPIPKITAGPEGGLAPKTISEDYKKDVTALGQARDLIHELKSTWDTLDIKGKAHGAMLYGQAYAGTNPKARMYLDSREAMLGNISRSIAAERGVLTNQDIDRIKGIIAKFGPNIITNDSPKDAQEKWAEIDRILDKADKRMQQRSNITQSNPTGSMEKKIVKPPLEQKSTRFQLPDGGFVNIPNGKVEEFLKDPESKGARRVK